MDRAGGYQDSAFVAEFYDEMYRERQDIAFWIEEAQASGGPVLEVGCGTGRVLIPIARAGVEITGLDLSGSMLGVCRERLAGEPDEVRARARLVQADMRAFDLGQRYREQKFALVTVPFRPFQHLETVADQLSCLRSIHRHLAPGGRLILDLFNPSVHTLAREVTGCELEDGPELVLPDGRRVLRCHRFVSIDLYNQVNHVELVFYVTHPDGRQERLVHAFGMRYLFRYEAEHLLARCGFVLEQVYAGYDKRPYGSEYPGELIMVARRDE